MATTAEQYGFGARAPYAQPRASDYDMKERVRLSGLFPRVRNQPMSNQLQALMKDFEKNAALTGILERRRRLEERLQFELKGSEGMDALSRNLAPPFRAGLAGAATSASVADRLARSRVAGQLAAAQAAQEAADVMTGTRPAAKQVATAKQPAAKVRIRAPPKAGVFQQGGATASSDPLLAKAKVVPVVKPPPPKIPGTPQQAAPGTPLMKANPKTPRAQSPSNRRPRV